MFLQINRTESDYGVKKILSRVNFKRSFFVQVPTKKMKKKSNKHTKLGEADPLLLLVLCFVLVFSLIYLISLSVIFSMNALAMCIGDFLLIEVFTYLHFNKGFSLFVSLF